MITAAVRLERLVNYLPVLLRVWVRACPYRVAPLAVDGTTVEAVPVVLEERRMAHEDDPGIGCALVDLLEVEQDRVVDL
ncbi:hypothetical protein [Kitasatospora sp. NBC_01302]|uniref:hypothetical protein n=1 Tax=Kitasatospora sp. NBC_01302 TaxID=2903575 RepID=UPI002E1136C5|nr:hypothetical protein OG294_28790 [Kitasatospora sp. NBC_01302]